MSDSPLAALLSPKRRLQLQHYASTSPDPPLLSTLTGGTPLTSPMRGSFSSEEDKAALSCAGSASTSPNQTAAERLSVSQRVKGLESSTKNPLIRPFQLGSPASQTQQAAAALMGSPIERPYRRATFETQGKPLSSPTSAAANAAVEPLPSPLRSRRVSAPVPSPSHAAAVAAAHAARRLTAPPVFSLPAAPAMTHAQSASPLQQQHPSSPVQLQAYQPRFHPYAEKALQSTVTLLSAAAIAPIGAADFLPAAASAGLGGRAATAAQPCSSPSSSTQPAAAAKATAAAHFFSATALVNLKAQHVPICCSRHGSLLFLSSIPPPPVYRGLEKVAVAPEKSNTIPKLPLWALAAAAAVQPSAEKESEETATVGGAHTRYPSGPSISAWIAEASAAAALNPMPLSRATSSSATPRSVPFPSSSSSGGSGEATSQPLQSPQQSPLPQPLQAAAPPQLSQWQQAQTQSQCQSQSQSPGPPALPRFSGLSVHVQGTPTPPTQQRNLAPAEIVPLGSPLSGVSNGSNSSAAALLSSATPPPQHRLPASFHAQTAPFNFSGSSGNSGGAGSTLRVPNASAGAGSNASPTPRSATHSAQSSAHSAGGGATTSSPSYHGLQYPPVSPGNLRPPPVLALGYAAVPSSSSNEIAAASTPPLAAATAAAAAVSRIASLRTTFESSPSPLARQQPAPMGSPNPASSPPPPIPSFTPRARAVSAGYTQPQQAQSPHANASITPRALGPPLVPASPVPPPLPPFVPRDRPGSSGGGRSNHHASSAPSTPLSPSRSLLSRSSAAERAPLLTSTPALAASPEINSRTALLGADAESASASPSPPASIVSASATASASASGQASASGVSMSPSPSLLSPSPSPSPSVSPPLLPPIPASFRTTASGSPLASSSAAESASHAQLASLQQQLIDAVQLQHFEACIGLRDRIRAIEEELARETSAEG